MNTTKTTTVGGQTIPLDPPTPPRKPHKLLWIDLETTAVSRTEAKILEIGMIVTNLDGTEEGDRFIPPRPPRPCEPLRPRPQGAACTSTTGYWTPSWKPNPKNSGYANVARNLGEFLDTEASQYVLHPAGTNVDYDIDVLTNQLGPHLHP